jgi:hypothetical protein
MTNRHCGAEQIGSSDAIQATAKYRPKNACNRAGALTGEGMHRFAKFVLHLVPSLVLISAVLSGGQCVAQEIDVPGGRGSGALVAPTAWVEFIAPVRTESI